MLVELLLLLLLLNRRWRLLHYLLGRRPWSQSRADYGILDRVALTHDLLLLFQRLIDFDAVVTVVLREGVFVGGHHDENVAFLDSHHLRPLYVRPLNSVRVAFDKRKILDESVTLSQTESRLLHFSKDGVSRFAWQDDRNVPDAAPLQCFRQRLPNESAQILEEIGDAIVVENFAVLLQLVVPHENVVNVRRLIQLDLVFRKIRSRIVLLRFVVILLNASVELDQIGSFRPLFESFCRHRC